MPWKSFPEGDKGFCIYKVDEDGNKTGKSLGCYPDKAKAAAQIKALADKEGSGFVPFGKKKVEMGFEADDGFGWTLLAVANTNRPATRMKDAEITLTTIDGKEYIRVPIIKKAVVNYRNERIIRFDQAVFDQVLKNHEAEVWDSAPYFRVSHETGDQRPPAGCWFDKSTGGAIKQEGDWLIGYGIPTGDDVKEDVRRKRYRYASADLHPNYKSSQIATLEGVISTLNFEELSDDQIIRLQYAQEETTMPDNTTVSAEGLDALNREISDLKSKLATAEAKIKELTPAPELDLPPEAKAQIEALERKNQELELKFERKNREDMIAARNRTVDALAGKWGAVRKDGKGHPAFVIETAKAILLEGEVKAGDKVLKLEFAAGQAPSLDQYRIYVFEAVTALMDGLPPTMPTETITRHTDSGPGDEVVEAFVLETASGQSQSLEDFYTEEANRQFGIKANGNGQGAK